MKNLSTFNKLFLIFCAIVIAFLAYSVPREKQDSQSNTESAFLSE